MEKNLEEEVVFMNNFEDREIAKTKERLVNLKGQRDAWRPFSVNLKGQRDAWRPFSSSGYSL